MLKRSGVVLVICAMLVSPGVAMAWNGVADTAGGAAHLVTFPVTKLDLPLPEGSV